MPRLLLIGALLPLCSSLLLQGTNVRASVPTARCAVNLGLFDGLKKLVDPEDAMSRNVLEDELTGGDGSAESLAATKRRKAEAARKAEAGESGGLPFDMPKFEMPKMGLPNPFEKK